MYFVPIARKIILRVLALASLVDKKRKNREKWGLKGPTKNEEREREREKRAEREKREKQVGQNNIFHQYSTLFIEIR